MGRDGPKIYDNWNQCNSKVLRFPGAIHKGFGSLQEAENWLAASKSSTLPVSSLATDGSQSNAHTSLCSTARHQRQISKKDSQAIDSQSSYKSALVHDDDSSLRPTTSAVTLSPEQNAVLNKVKAGKSVFFTGSAGTGKSVLLREIIQFSGGSASSTLGITASTGIAAVNIGGVTLHSWAGIGIGNETAKNVVGKFFGQAQLFSNVIHRWQSVKTLIIDEISMIDGELFDKLEYMARGLRHSEKPFGGIQLILCGDFCQLPPVGGRDAKGQVVTPAFAFDAQTWSDCVGPPITLTRVFRQKDQTFVDMLNEMRFGRMNRLTTETFKSLSRRVVYTDGIEPTELFSTRAEVDRANLSRLRQLPGECFSYEAADSAGVDANGVRVTQVQMDRILKRFVAPQSIQLKVGAQVMLIKNLIQGQLVNGSVGQVTKFVSLGAARLQDIPVATIEGQEVKSRFQNDAILWPIVRFIGGREMIIVPQDFTANNPNGEVEAQRTQIPLILAWALSVHKSQGQTLERVKVDLGRTFEKGQAYVAISRATTMEQLQVINFDAAKVLAHPRVLEWYHQTQSSSVDSEMDNEEAMAAYYDI